MGQTNKARKLSIAGGKGRKYSPCTHYTGGDSQALHAWARGADPTLQMGKMKAQNVSSPLEVTQLVSKRAEGCLGGG